MDLHVKQKILAIFYRQVVLLDLQLQAIPQGYLATRVIDLVLTRPNFSHGFEETACVHQQADFLLDHSVAPLLPSYFSDLDVRKNCRSVV